MGFLVKPTKLELRVGTGAVRGEGPQLGPTVAGESCAGEAARLMGDALKMLLLHRLSRSFTKLWGENNSSDDIFLATLPPFLLWMALILFPPEVNGTSLNMFPKETTKFYIHPEKTPRRHHCFFSSLYLKLQLAIVEASRNSHYWKPTPCAKRAGSCSREDERQR
ncbi:hypothetical protein EK904_009828 [Melospiza melodia maxima]|nr:hypothetical protein EK904_009828 [Melospiza melodia maxima]